MKRTKIVATLGPASHSIDIIAQMISAGMNVARLNFSHGSYDDHAELISNIREASKKAGKTVAILQDLQGPKIRIGELPDAGIEITKDQSIQFDTALQAYAGDIIPVDYADLHMFVKAGDRLLINDGKIATTVTEVDHTTITARVDVDGTLLSHKGINVPDTELAGRALTDKDKKDAAFGISQHVDFIALSFVQTSEDITELRHHIEVEKKKQHISSDHEIKIIAKIERPAALDNIQSIMNVVDGIMVARGDLGVETSAARVPVVQKDLILRSLKHAKPVIVATQMLDSMQDNPRPTRAEVSDVANAVIDHTDAVMLSNESAVGKYPVETVTTMADIISETEGSALDALSVNSMELSSDRFNVIAHISKLAAEEANARAILTVSRSGETARHISRFRPELPIYVGVLDDRVRRQLSLTWGVTAFQVSTLATSREQFVSEALEILTKSGKLTAGDRVILVAGDPLGEAPQVNAIEIIEV